MSNSIEKPIVDGVNFPEVLLPWSPTKRSKILLDLRWQILNSNNTANIKKLGSDYLNQLNRRYLIPSLVAGSTVNLIPDYNLQRLALIETTANETATLRKFETEFLGLTSKQLVYQESASGFAAGRYSTALVEEALGTPTDSIVDFIEADESGHPWIVARADDFLIPIDKRSANHDELVISGVMELNVAGAQIVDMLLRAFENGAINGLPAPV